MSRWRRSSAIFVAVGIVLTAGCGLVLSDNGAAKQARKDLAPIEEAPDAAALGGGEATDSTAVDREAPGQTVPGGGPAVAGQDGSTPGSASPDGSGTVPGGSTVGPDGVVIPGGTSGSVGADGVPGSTGSNGTPAFPQVTLPGGAPVGGNPFVPGGGPGVTVPVTIPEDPATRSLCRAASELGALGAALNLDPSVFASAGVGRPLETRGKAIVTAFGKVLLFLPDDIRSRFGGLFTLYGELSKALDTDTAGQTVTDLPQLIEANRGDIIRLLTAIGTKCPSDPRLVPTA